MSELIEDVTLDGYRIRSDFKHDLLLEGYYHYFNQQCFGGSLGHLHLFWAEIKTPDGKLVNGLYVCNDVPDGKTKRYIAIDSRLQLMYPFERLSLLHEMVHVKLEPIGGHGPEFVAEFRRALDAEGWSVLGGGFEG